MQHFKNTPPANASHISKYDDRRHIDYTYRRHHKNDKSSHDNYASRQQNYQLRV